jgi:hypothetical protein
VDRRPFVATEHNLWPFFLSGPSLNLANGKRSTTAGLLANTWHVLARRPDIWNKLRVEVDALNGQQPTYAEIKDMKYLKYVFNESLRLMPVVPGNSRVAIRDTILPLGGGPEGKSPVLVEAGDTVSPKKFLLTDALPYFLPMYLPRTCACLGWRHFLVSLGSTR